MNILGTMVEVIRQTIMITSLVLVMMLFIEFINVLSHGNWAKNLAKSRFKQLLISVLLGLVPGCIGGFAVVSLFTHNFVNFGALTAALLVSTGDEAFVMFSMFPGKALLLHLILFVLAIGVGLLLNLLAKPLSKVQPQFAHIHIHSHEFDHHSINPKNAIQNLKTISFSRTVLILGLLLFLFGILTGQFEHEAHQSHESIFELGIENLVFVVLALFVLYILLVVNEHFLEEHLWGHIIKKHFLRIFLWTFGALAVIEWLNHFVDITPWLQENRLVVLLVALLVGIIPQSGPHLVFVTLFFSSSIPFSVLLANSIVQDGHSTLPLLAESKRSFIIVKAINLLIGGIAGMIGFWMGW